MSTKYSGAMIQTAELAINEQSTAIDGLLVQLEATGRPALMMTCDPLVRET